MGHFAAVPHDRRGPQAVLNRLSDCGSIANHGMLGRASNRFFLSSRVASKGKLGQPRLQPFTECVEPFAIIKVTDESHMPQVKWNVRLCLRNQDDLAAKRVCDPNLIKNVRIPARAVTDDYAGSIDQ